jgi:acetylornithine deacetylase
MAIGTSDHAGASTQVERQLTEALTRQADDLAQLVADLVAIPSVTGEEGAAAEFVYSWLRDNGFPADKRFLDPSVLRRWPDCAGESDLDKRPNVVGRLAAAEPACADLVLNGHLDVVPTGDADRWSHPPFSGTREGGRIWGRGTADMKGGIAAALFAMRAVRDAGVELPFGIQVQCVVAEESGGLGTLGLMADSPPPLAVICLEPTACQVVSACGGAAPFTVTVPGKPAHVASPWTGVSAFDKLLLVHQRLLEFSDERERTLDHPLFNQLPKKAAVSVGRVEAGEWRLSLPEEARLYGRTGALPGEQLGDIRALIEESIAGLGADDPWLRAHPCTVTWDGPGFPGWETRADTDLVVSLLSAAETLRGNTSLAAATYGSDAGVFAGMGAPVALFGPGELTEAHTTDESVGADDVTYVSQATALAITRLAATARR